MRSSMNGVRIPHSLQIEYRRIDSVDVLSLSVGVMVDQSSFAFPLELSHTCDPHEGFARDKSWSVNSRSVR